MHFIVFCLFILVGHSVFAQVESQIQFRGQNAELIKIEKDITVTIQETYQAPDTCTRQIPYEAYECRDITHHREECSWVPSRENCWTDSERVCRTVTRTRQECSNGPSRRVCHDRPDREVCTPNPSRQVCTDRPGREVCTERPTREVCRPKPGGGETCTTVGGGRNCTTVGGGRSCETVGGGETCRRVDGGQSCSEVPGERVCRDVSYNDQDCTDVPRQRCETIPGHNACVDVPYTEEVCGNVTRHRAERYACTRTAQRPVAKIKKLIGEISVHFLTNGIVEEFPLKVVANPINEQSNNYELKVELVKEPTVFVVLRKKEIKSEVTDAEIKLSGEVTLEILEPSMITPIFPSKISRVSKSGEFLRLDIEGQISGLGTIEVIVMNNPKIGRKKEIINIVRDYPHPSVSIEDKAISLKLEEINGKFTKKNTALIKLSAPVSVNGELLNAKKPMVQQAYEIGFRP